MLYHIKAVGGACEDYVGITGTGGGRRVWNSKDSPTCWHKGDNATVLWEEEKKVRRNSGKADKEDLLQSIRL